MKATLALIISLSLLYSCTVSKGISGTYQKGPYEVTTSKSLDDAWGIVIDQFANHGYPISVIDKNSGIISSGVLDFSDLSTSENSKGAIQNLGAYIVIENYQDPFRQYRTEVEGQWNVRVKEINGNTIVRINIVNLRASQINNHNNLRVAVLEARSTGNFEKDLAELITSGEERIEKSVPEPMEMASEDSDAIANEVDQPEPSASTQVLVHTARDAPKSMPQTYTSSDVVTSEEMALMETKLTRMQTSMDTLEEKIKILQEIADVQKQISDKRDDEIIKRIEIAEGYVAQNTSDIRKSKSNPSSLRTASYTAPQPTASPTASVTTASSPPSRYRTVQFVATVPGKTYNELSYLGDLVTEQVPGKKIVRYKIGGNFSDADIRRVIAKLADHGYKGAYEN